MLTGIAGFSIDIHDGILCSRDIRNVHVVSCWRKVLDFLLREEIGADNVGFCVAMLSRLGERDVSDLAWAT